VDFVLRRARDTAIVNIHPMAALTKGLLGQEMTEIGLLKAAGAVAFSDGDRSVTNAQVMRRALTYARDFDALIVHHTEDPNLVGEGVMNEGEFAARRGLAGIPDAAEAVMLERDMRLVALSCGLLDVIMSDHNPQDVEVKRLPFAEAASGAVGLQTMLPAALRLVHNGELDFKALIRAMSTRPAELLGLPGGTLRAGSPADVIVIDPDTPWVLDPADLKSQCKNTPFDEARFSGRVVRTIVGGR